MLWYISPLSVQVIRSLCRYVSFCLHCLWHR